jgi:hypothetical protein
VRPLRRGDCVGDILNIPGETFNMEISVPAYIADRIHPLETNGLEGYGDDATVHTCTSVFFRPLTQEDIDDKYIPTYMPFVTPGGTAVMLEAAVH